MLKPLSLLSDKSGFGWATVNEYLSDELTSYSDNEKRIYQAKRRAKRKINKEKHHVDICPEYQKYLKVLLGFFPALLDILPLQFFLSALVVPAFVSLS